MSQQTNPESIGIFTFIGRVFARSLSTIDHSLTVVDKSAEALAITADIAKEEAQGLSDSMKLERVKRIEDLQKQLESSEPTDTKDQLHVS